MLRKEKKKKITGMFLSAFLSAVFLAGCSISIDFGTDETAEDEFAVHFIDVGQGDSTLIVSGDYTVLIDAGEIDSGFEVTSYLSEQGISSIDYVIATHPHSDHIGGLADVLNTVKTDNVIVPHISDEEIPTTQVYMKFLEAVDKNGCNFREAVIGEKINLGMSEIEILAPVTDEYDNLNNFSIISELTYDNVKFLFTADAETESETDVIEAGTLEDVDVFKAGHHGSSTSSSKKFLEVIKPEYVVISCGVGNSYGHPSEKAMKRLTEYTENIYRTDLQGDIVFKSDGADIFVEYGE